MSVSLYHTQRIRGFQSINVKYIGRTMFCQLKRTRFNCIRCGSEKVAITPMRRRQVHGEPMGYYRKVLIEFTAHRLYCRCCHHREMEHVPFLSHPKARITRCLERTVLELRQHMSIQAVANYFQLRWHTVKDLEKRALERKYSRIQTAHVKAIGLDEIYVSRSRKEAKYLTIIRDLDSGSVIHVGDGKGLRHWKEPNASSNAVN